MSETFQRLREHRLKCLFDEKLSTSVKQRIINNLCKTQERKLTEMMRTGLVLLRENMKDLKKREKILSKFIVNSVTGQLVLAFKALKRNKEMEIIIGETIRNEGEKNKHFNL